VDKATVMGGPVRILIGDALYTLSWSRKKGNSFLANRGYGSFMNPFNYETEGFEGSAHDFGAWGAAAGDIDGDGAVDPVSRVFVGVMPKQFAVFCREHTDPL
jgi:hypothetical protein